MMSWYKSQTSAIKNLKKIQGRSIAVLVLYKIYLSSRKGVTEARNSCDKNKKLMLVVYRVIQILIMNLTSLAITYHI